MIKISNHNNYYCDKNLIFFANNETFYTLYDLILLISII